MRRPPSISKLDGGRPIIECVGSGPDQLDSTKGTGFRELIDEVCGIRRPARSAYLARGAEHVSSLYTPTTVKGHVTRPFRPS